MSSRRLYLVASAGFPNYGDELIAAQWLRYLAEHHPDDEVWLDCPSPGSAEVLLGALHPRVRFVDTVFQIAWAAPSEEPWEVADFASRATRFPGVVPRRAAGVDVLQEADVFHLLGGGYINTLWPRHVALVAVGATLAAEFGARAALTGAGLVPSSASAALLQRLTERYAVVDVRDTQSQAMFAGNRATLSGDDVFLGVGPHLYDKRESRPVMLCLQEDLVEGGVSAIAETVLATLAQWRVTGGDVGYVEAMPGHDRRLFELLEPFLPGMRFYPFTELWAHGLPARPGQRWLTTRFHLHLVAATAGASGAVLVVKPGYYDVKHGALIEQGSGWSVLQPGASTKPTRSQITFGLPTSTLVTGKRAVAAEVYAVPSD